MESTLRITRDADNIATVWLDLPGKSVNTVTPQVLSDLDAALTELSQNAPAGVIFASAKKGNFVAGADLFEIRKMNREQVTKFLTDGQKVFGRIAALSPSVWWNQRVLHRMTAAANIEPRPRIWLDIGTQEGPRIVQDVEQFRDILLQKGWQLGKDLSYHRVEGAEHNEAAWAQRVGPFLQFLYPAAESTV